MFKSPIWKFALFLTHSIGLLLIFIQERNICQQTPLLKMSKVLSNDKPLCGFSGQSDFSATIDSTCSSEDMLYKITPGTLYFDSEDAKKTVTFGDVVFNEPESSSEYNQSKEDKGGLLLSMFTYIYKDKEHPQETTINEEMLLNQNKEHNYDTTKIDTFDFSSLPQASNRNNNPSINNSKSTIVNDDDELLDNTLLDINTGSSTNPLLSNYYEEPTEIAVTPTKLNMPQNNYILTPDQIISDMNNPDRKPTHGAHKSKSLIRIKKQNTLLKEQNKDLVNKTIALTTCITAQQQNITNYEFFITNLQERISNMKTNYDTCVQKNDILDDNLKKAVQQIELSQLQLQALRSVQNSKEHQIRELEKIPNLESYSKAAFDEMKKMVEILQFKNKCLQDVNTLLSKKMNGLYRFTVAPALHLMRKDNDEDLDQLLSFDSNNQIQFFMDSKYHIFEKLQSLNLEVYGNDDFDSIRHRNELKRRNILSEIENYFSKLNEIVVDQFIMTQY